MADLIWEIASDPEVMYCTAGDSPPTIRYIDIEFEQAVSAIVTPLVRFEHFECWASLGGGNWQDHSEFMTMEVEQIKAQTARIKVTLYEQSQLDPNTYLSIAAAVQIKYVYIYGTLVGKGFTKTITEIDQASIDEHGRRTLDLTSTLALDEATTRDMLKSIVANLKQPTPLVAMTVVGDTDAKLVQLLTLTMSDRVEIIATKIGMDAEFHIEKVRHEITEGRLHYVTYNVTKVPGTEIAILDGGAELDEGFVLTY